MPGLNGHLPEPESCDCRPGRRALLPSRNRWGGGFDQIGLGVPAYTHPLLAPEEWAELSRPGSPLHWVVINVSFGPGVRPDPLFLDAAERLRDSGVRLLGYLDTAHGRRTCGDLVPQARRHVEWYGVEGFFLDRVPLAREELPHYRRTVSTLRALAGEALMVFKHGSHPDPGYADIADQLVTYAGPWSGYRWSRPPAWTANHPPERFCHFVHAVPGAQVGTALRMARGKGAATVYLTDREGVEPWAGLPSYWPEATRATREQPRLTG